ncbi:CPBP family intramembrane glutamic endopeptidase [Oleiagrimonas soli]|uniref:CAAX prenyl protease 2/Lysostaphin resistance protein A-like domain-containing protein n=1 Tax=Oleiagrimonas soli TaxID=1543381 RepID=A0A099CVD3_9GAMM|nr:CPBP family intramembrane glutamic endopeptidase [Oleiagrimonas soli]KGI77636.1 hypothetical protein LF63_0110095 [Oleiagrimonas soli]MBB6182864.1 hypothetical protein [Oleiagrimonas soli]
MDDTPIDLPAVEPPPSPDAPRLRFALGAIVLYFLIQAFTGFLVGMVFMMVEMVANGVHDPKAVLQSPDTRMLLLLMILPLSCLASILVFRLGYRRVWRTAGHEGLAVRPIRPTQFSLHVLLGIATGIVGSMLTYLLTQGHPIGQDIGKLMLHTSLPMRLGLGLLVVTLVPLAEEILFRGILLPALIRHMPIALAVAIDACLFAAIHLPDLGWKPQGLLALALVGAVCCWRRLKTGSIYSAVAVHAGNNLLAMVALIASHR